MQKTNASQTIWTWTLRKFIISVQWACECGQESCKEQGECRLGGKLFYEYKKKTTFKHNISPDDREIVKGLLIKYQQSFVNNEDESHLYTGTNIASGLPRQVINNIVDDLHTIGDQTDLHAMK